MMSSLLPATSCLSPSSSSLRSVKGRNPSDTATMPLSETVTTTRNEKGTASACKPDPLGNHNHHHQQQQTEDSVMLSSFLSDAVDLVEAAIVRGQAQAAAADSVPTAASTTDPQHSHTSAPEVRRPRDYNNNKTVTTAPSSSTDQQQEQPPSAEESSSSSSSSRPSKKRRTTTTPKTGALVRRDYGLLLPKDFLPIQYSAASGTVGSCTTTGTKTSNSIPAKRSALTRAVLPYMAPHRWMGRHLLPLQALDSDSLIPNRPSSSSSSSCLPSLCWIESMLSDDVLGRCLYSGYLNSMETARLGRVCKKWRSMARRSVSQLDLRRLSARGQLDQCQMNRLVSIFPYLTTLNVSYCPQWGANQELLCLVPLSRSLLRLGLKGTAVTDEDVTRYFHEVHVQLDFQTTTSPLLELDLSAISKEGSVRISNVTVETIVKYCPSLQVLRLAWCSHVNDDSIDTMLATPSSPGLSQLEELDLSLTGISDACIPSLARLLVQNGSTLKRLDLSATQMTAEGMGRLVWMVRVLLQQQQYRKDDDGSMTTARSTSPTVDEASCAMGGSKTSAATNSFAAHPAAAAPWLALEHLTMRFLADMTLETVETWFRVARYLTFLDVTYSGPDGALSMIATTQGHSHLIQLFQERCLVSKTNSVIVKGILCQTIVVPTIPSTATAFRSPASSSSKEEEKKDNDEADTNSLSTYATPPKADPTA